MEILGYELKVDPIKCTAEKYFHLMWQHNWKPEEDKVLNLADFERKLTIFSREYKEVTWNVRICHRKKNYLYVVKAGKYTKITELREEST